jgi:hypothetical protein
MSADVEAAVDYPLRGNGAVKRFLIGGGVPSLLSVAFVVLGFVTIFAPPAGILLVLLFPVSVAFGLALSGYYVRVARETYAGSDEPPSFSNWTGLVVDGGYCVLIGLGYSLPLVLAGVVVAAVFAVLVGGAPMGGTEMESAAAALGLVSMLVFGLLALLAVVYSLVVSYLYPISVCIYADTRDVRTAFSKERLRAVATSEDYLVPWLLQAGAMVGIQTVVSMLTIILVGYLLYPFLPFATFYVTTAAFYLFAQAYDGHVGAEGADPDTDERGTARTDASVGGEAGY